LNGDTTPMAPGQSFEYLVPDIFGRPWAQIWERYHEDGLQQPVVESIFDFEGV
jgi:hypothetical protein